MSVQAAPEGGTLRHVAAAEIRAELARQRKTSRQLARVLEMSPQALSRRTGGELPFDLDEIERAAAFLQVPLARLLGLATQDGPDPQGGKTTRWERAGDRRGGLKLIKGCAPSSSRLRTVA